MPAPEPPRKAKRRSGVVSVLIGLLVVGAFTSVVFLRLDASLRKRRAVEEETARRTTPKPPPPPPRSAPVNDRIQEDWTRTKAAIRVLEEEMRYAEAGDLCDRFVQRHGAQAPPESRTALTELRSWATSVQQAELSRKQPGRRSLDLLNRGGPSRAKDRERILAKWCEEDWTETKRAIEEELARSNPYRARDLLDRFLKLPHEGGSHKADAEARKLGFDAEFEFMEISERTEGFLRSNRGADAVAAWEAFLAQPHRGGARKEEAEKRLATIRATVRQMIYAGRGTVTRLIASPNGKRIAFSTDRLRVHDLSSRSEVWSKTAPSLVKSMAFAGDSLLVTAHTYRIAFWDLEKDAEARGIKISDGYITAMAVSRDGKRIVASRSDGALLTWEGDSETPATVEKNGATGVTVLALSPDGSKIAMAGPREKAIRLRDLSTGGEQKWATGPAGAAALAWNPEGTRLASAGLDEAAVWDVAKGQVIHRFEHKGALAAVTFTAGGARIASAGGVDRTIRLWNTADGSGAGALTGHQDRVTGLVALRDGTLISGAADGTVRIWSLTE
jgi:hypothetical protein